MGVHSDGAWTCGLRKAEDCVASSCYLKVVLQSMFIEIT